MFCNNVNAFTVTFDQINTSLLNKSINFSKKTSDPKKGEFVDVMPLVKKKRKSCISYVMGTLVTLSDYVNLMKRH